MYRYSNPDLNRALERMDRVIDGNAAIIQNLSQNIVDLAEARQDVRWHEAEREFTKKMKSVSKRIIKRGGEK